MAHTCPDCGQLCHCGGDIDDIDWGEDSKCSHFRTPGCDGYDEWADDADDEVEGDP